MNTLRDDAIFFLFKLLDPKRKIRVEEIKKILKDENTYRYVPQRKNNGKVRHCYAPSDNLKKLQQAILQDLLHKIPVHPNLCGFVPGISMKSGVERHLREISTQEKTISTWTLRLDIKNCFPSVRKNILKKMFEDIFADILYEKGLRNTDIYLSFCELLLELTTYKGGLIQGAPTSPYLTNLVISWSGIADRLEEYCKNRKDKKGFPLGDLNFSIYADDIAISSNSRGKIPIKPIVFIIEKGGIFKINTEKTKRNHFCYGSHRITGISFSSVLKTLEYEDILFTRMTLPQKKQKLFRGRIWQAILLLKSGFRSDDKIANKKINQAKGCISWTKHVCGDNIPSSLKKVISEFERLKQLFKAG